MSLQALAELGVVPTVYSLVYPETRAVFDEIRMQSDLHAMYEQAWTKHQDPMHERLFARWREWAAPVIDVDWGEFPYQYVASGSSEAIRDSIAGHVADARLRGRGPRIHVFDGEYEGFAAFADAYHCEVVSHNRREYEMSLAASAEAGDRFYVSAPSSIDGMVWPGMGDFVRYLGYKHPGVRLAVDLCYVGCVGCGHYQIDLTSPSIDAIFFSLSKVFGVYYHRIGGVFSREPLQGLHGNVWFKNLLSIRFGAELLDRFGVFELPQRYRPHQERIVEALRPVAGNAVQASDVVLLARHEGPSGDLAVDKPFGRSPDGLRFCLTPALDQLIKGRS